jgi:hypothetical protein
MSNNNYSRRRFAKAALAWTGLLFVPRHLAEGVRSSCRWRARLPLAVAGGGGGGLTIVTTDTKTGAPGVSGDQVLTHALTGVPAGALLVVTAANELDNNGGLGVITVAGGGLTWTSQASAYTISSGNCRIYTAVFAAGGSISVAVTNAAGGSNQPAASSVCYVITGQESTLGGASTSATAQNQPNVSLTTTRASSLIFCVCSDWNARAGTPTARLGTITLNHDLTTANYRGVHIKHTATTATAYGMGYTGANTGGNNACGVCLYEVRTP